MWINSDLLPNIGSIADKSLLSARCTEAINHDPAIAHINTTRLGRPGSWLSYAWEAPIKIFPRMSIRRGAVKARFDLPGAAVSCLPPSGGQVQEF